MALPTLQKTWRFCNNVARATSGTGSIDYRTNLLALKQALCNEAPFNSWTDSAGAGASAPPAWTVVGSSNGVAASMDGTDRWTGYTAITTNTYNAAHSWIVLKQTGIASNFQICIDLVNPYGSSSYERIRPGVNNGAVTGAGAGGMFVSQLAGFSGGTTLVRPSATDETQIFMPRSGSADLMWMGNWAVATPFSGRWHVQRSDDGKCNRISYWVSNYCMGFFILDVPRDPITIASTPSRIWNKDDIPWVGAWVANQSYTNANWHAMIMGGETDWMDQWWLSSRIARAADANANSHLGMYLAAEATGIGYATRALDVVSELDGTYPMLPLALLVSGAGYRGRPGTMFDLWLGNPALLDGDTYPEDGTRQFVQLGDFILPWDRSAVLLS